MISTVDSHSTVCTMHEMAATRVCAGCSEFVNYRVKYCKACFETKASMDRYCDGCKVSLAGRHPNAKYCESCYPDRKRILRHLRPPPPSEIRQSKTYVASIKSVDQKGHTVRNNPGGIGVPREVNVLCKECCGMPWRIKGIVCKGCSGRWEAEPPPEPMNMLPSSGGSLVVEGRLYGYTGIRETDSHTKKKEGDK